MDPEAATTSATTKSTSKTDKANLEQKPPATFSTTLLFTLYSSRALNYFLSIPQRFLKVTCTDNICSVQVYEYENGKLKNTITLEPKKFSHYFRHDSSSQLIGLYQVNKQDNKATPIFWFKGGTHKVCAFKSFLIEQAICKIPEFTPASEPRLNPFSQCQSEPCAICPASIREVAIEYTNLDKEVEQWTSYGLRSFFYSIKLYGKGTNKDIGYVGAFVTDNGDSFIEKFMQHCQNGESLKHVKKSAVSSLISSPYILNQIWAQISSLQQEGTFNPKQRKVFDKLMADPYTIPEGEDEYPIKAMSWAKELSSVEGLCKGPLNLQNFKKGKFNVAFYASLDEDFWKQITSSVLYLTNTSNLVNIQWGLMHCGIIIGPWVIDWVNNSISKPRLRQNGAENALVVVDLCSFDTTDPEQYKSLQTLIEQVATVVVEYNLTKPYSRSNDNCHQFTLQAMTAAGVQILFKPRVEKFIQTASRTGNAQMLLDVTDCHPEFQKRHRELVTSAKFMALFPKKQFTYSPSSICFETHELLDYYSNAMRAVTDFPEEAELLKAFDRAFYMRLFRAKRKLEVLEKHAAKYQTRHGVKNLNQDEKEELIHLVKQYSPLHIHALGTCPFGKGDDIPVAVCNSQSSQTTATTTHP